MARIYKRSDRISVKIDDVTIQIAPLSAHQKSEVQQALIVGRTKGDIREATRGVLLAIKYAVKGIQGVEDGDGKTYQLEFDGDELSDACVDDLMNLDITERMTLVCVALVKKIPQEFTDERGEKMQGVEILNPAQESASKN